MANVVPVDAYTGEWYPGYRPEHFAAPYVVDGASPFRPGDEERLKKKSDSRELFLFIA